MALTTVSGLFIPRMTMMTVPTVFTSTLLLDASGEQAGFVFYAPKTGSIRKLHFRTGAVTTATDTDVRLETVSTTTGLPTGTLFGANTNVTVLAAAITATTWIQSGALTADASVTRGDMLAVVIAPTSTPNFVVASASLDTSSAISPVYSALKTGGTWAISTTNPVCAVEYSDGTYAYIEGAYPISAFTTHSVASNVSPDEIALTFSFAGPVRLTGVWFNADRDGDLDIVLYDGTTALATISRDADVDASTANRPNVALFGLVQELTASTVYRVALKPTTTTAITAFSYDVFAVGLHDQTAGGQAFYYSERTDAGAWTDVTTRRPFIGLILDQIDDGTGTGSGSGNLHHGLVPPHWHTQRGRR